MNIEKLKDHLREEEGYRDTVYKDHLGFATIGYGHLVKPHEHFIKDKKYDRKELEKIFNYDVAIAIQDSKKLCEGIDNEEVIEIVAHMCFQLGRPKTAKFVKMFEAIRNKDYIEAGLQMEDSLWAKKHTPARASRLAEQMKKLT